MGTIIEVLQREAWVQTVVRQTSLNLLATALLPSRKLLRTFDKLFPLELNSEPAPEITDSSSQTSTA